MIVLMSTWSVSYHLKLPSSLIWCECQESIFVILIKDGALKDLEHIETKDSSFLSYDVAVDLEPKVKWNSIG